MGVKKATKYFEESESSEAPDPDWFFGRAFLVELKKNFSQCLEVINQTIVTFQHLVPALIEKMRLQLALQDWDQVLDSSSRWVQGVLR